MFFFFFFLEGRQQGTLSCIFLHRKQARCSSETSVISHKNWISVTYLYMTKRNQKKRAGVCTPQTVLFQPPQFPDRQFV